MPKVTAEFTIEVTFEVPADAWEYARGHDVNGDPDVFFAMYAKHTKILHEERMDAQVTEVDGESFGDREDDSEEIKREAETTPCPNCGKIPDVQQHCEGLGVRHRCSTDLIAIMMDPGEVDFRGYAPDWISFCADFKVKAESAVCPQCKSRPTVDPTGRLGCKPGVCSNATGSFSHGGWLTYCEKHRDK